MKAHWEDPAGRKKKVTVRVKKGVKLKRQTDSICGPHGVLHRVVYRSCPHNCVHPYDWAFTDLEIFDQWDKYLCPEGCFKITIKW